MREIPKPLEQYMHFKGKRYQIVAVAKHSETMQQMVVYQALYGDYGIYVRPLDMFLSEVDHVKYPEVKQKYRFAHIGVDEVVMPEDSLAKKAVTNESKAILSDGTDVAGNEKKTGIIQTESDAENVYTEEEAKLDPLLLEFLDAKTTEERLNILTGLHARITQEMINTIAVVLDLNVPEGDLEERYEQVRYALFTKKKYEGTRLR